MTHATPTEIYESLVAAGTSPALVWYDDEGRVELSGKVFANHVAKIANFLEQDCDLLPGRRIVLDLPLHWKTLAWALGGLVAGGFVVVGRKKVNDHEPGTIIVTATPDEVSADDPEDLVVALNLDSFGFAWDGDLPDGVADGSAEVIGQADALLAEGLDGDSNASFWAQVLPNVPEVQRAVMVNPTLPQAIAFVYGQFELGRSVVLIGDERDSDAVAAIAESEIGSVLEL